MNKQLINRIALGDAADYELESLPLVEVARIKSDPELVQRRFYVEKEASIDTGKRLVSGVVMSTEQTDRMGDVIKVAGWELENFKANPQLLFAHDSHALPIGTPLRVRKGRTKKGFRALMCDEEYHEEGENPQAELVFRLVTKGALPGRSVGFRGLETEHPESDAERAKLGLGRYGILFKRAELLENSVVPIPANQYALQEKALQVAREVYKSGCDDLPRDVVKAVFEGMAFTAQDAERIARDIRRRSVVVPDLGGDLAAEIAKSLAADGDEAVGGQGDAKADTGAEAKTEPGDADRDVSEPDRDVSDVESDVVTGERTGAGLEEMSFDGWTAKELLELIGRAEDSLDEKLRDVGLTREDLAVSARESTSSVLLTLGKALETLSEGNAAVHKSMVEAVETLRSATFESIDTISDALSDLKEHLTEAGRAQDGKSTSAASAGEADETDAVEKLIKRFSFSNSDKADTE